MEMLKRFMLKGFYLSIILLITLHIMHLMPGDGQRLASYNDAGRDWNDGNYIEAARQYSDLGWFEDSRKSQKKLLSRIYEDGTEFLKDGRTFEATLYLTACRDMEADDETAPQLSQLLELSRDGLYQWAEDLLRSDWPEQAIPSLKVLGNYKDSAALLEQQLARVYDLGAEARDAGDTQKAVYWLGQAGGYRDADEFLSEYWKAHLPHYTRCGMWETELCLLTPENRFFLSHKPRDLEDSGRYSWENMVTISPYDYDMIGLQSDGSVCGDFPHEFFNPFPRAVQAVGSMGYSWNYGIVFENGTVYISDETFREATDMWTDVIDLTFLHGRPVALLADGTCIAADPNDQEQIAGWENIRQLAGNRNCLLGLTGDGTVLTAGDPDCPEAAAGQWIGITSLSIGDEHCAGLRTDGTVVTAGSDGSFMETDSWADLVRVDAVKDGTIGLDRDGKLSYAGDVAYFQDDCSYFEDQLGYPWPGQRY